MGSDHPCHAVLGIDVGYAKKRKSSGVALLYWNGGAIVWEAIHCAARDVGETVKRLLKGYGVSVLDAVGIDGPLAQRFGRIKGYRSVDALFMRGEFMRRGSAAKAVDDSPFVEKTRETAIWVRDHLKVKPWDETGGFRIHSKRIVEAHPVQFLGVQLTEKWFDGNGQALKGNRKKSDAFYQALQAEDQPLRRLVERLVPEARLARPLEFASNHDDRAAVVCALTALCAALGRYVAVGDPENGAVVLPPVESWGGLPRWAETEMQSSLEEIRSGRVNGVHNGRGVTAWKDGQVWPIEKLGQDHTDGH